MKRILGVVLMVVLAGLLFFITQNDQKKKEVVYNFIGKTVSEVNKTEEQKGLFIEYRYEESKETKDTIIKQERDNKKYVLTVSLGDRVKEYNEFNVNELGNIPIMMYHGIVDGKSNYVGGNVDKDGYQRTKEAFIKDLEFYYQNGYRMISLKDYLNGVISTPLGFSPIVLTFDDGLENNIKVTSAADGNIVIDPNSAVGILESFKQKYPDYNVTATFFITSGLFNQNESDKIITWLIEHGYDIGNHSYTHADISKISETETIREIGKMYELLGKYTDKYLNVVALPYGSPYAKTHPNFKHILSGRYNEVNYQTQATLRVGWEAATSPFHPDFDKTFLKRIRAYDNNGTDFDIKMTFDKLKTTRFISDGNKDIVTIKEADRQTIANKANFNYHTYTKK